MSQYRLFTTECPSEIQFSVSIKYQQQIFGGRCSLAGKIFYNSRLIIFLLLLFIPLWVLFCIFGLLTKIRYSYCFQC